jgi:hypothetical protein
MYKDTAATASIQSGAVNTTLAQGLKHSNIKLRGL